MEVGRIVHDGDPNAIGENPHGREAAHATGWVDPDGLAARDQRVPDHQVLPGVVVADGHEVLAAQATLALAAGLDSVDAIEFAGPQQNEQR